MEIVRDYKTMADIWKEQKEQKHATLSHSHSSSNAK